MSDKYLPLSSIAFIGGGNMASAIIGGLLRSGVKAEQLVVLEPYAPSRAKLLADYGVTAFENAKDASAATQPLQNCALVVWAVKPQMFKEAALPVAPYTASALHLSVAAGIATQSMAAWLGTGKIVRAMPNTPALIGMGMTGLYACPTVNPQERTLVEQVLGTTGQLLWLEDEKLLDAVTALSGSGPAYVFYFVEAMIQGGTALGLSPEQSKQLALQTFAGATALAQQSTESVAVLRERVTSKGGTTYAALTSMQNSQVQEAIAKAIHAAYVRAGELGQEFGT